MKISGFQKTGLTLAAATLLAISTGNVFAQNSTAPVTPPPPAPDLTPPNAPDTTAAPLSAADQQVLQLSQAKISDGTIINYIQNSSTIYGLTAPQIVYLKQNGVSEAVINAMLNQRNVVAAQQAPPPNYSQTAPPPGTTAPPPGVVVAQPGTPAPSVIVMPDTQTYDYDQWAAPYIYPYDYGYYPYVYPYYGYGWYAPGIYWGWGGWHGGWGGWHGGFGGGGFHGGFHSGGGFHGGGGGGFHR